ncbi:glycosyltransferase family 61 protein [Pseudochelatococcus sp. B33]
MLDAILSDGRNRDLFDDSPVLAEILFPEGDMPPPRPVPFPEFSGQFIADRHGEVCGKIPAIGLFQFNECFMADGGILLSEDRRIIISRNIINNYWLKNINKKLSVEDVSERLVKFVRNEYHDSIRYIEEPVVSLVKPGWLVYGHWLLDMLPMAWLYKRSTLFSREHRKYLIPSRTPAWAKNMLNIVSGLTEEDFIYFDDGKEIIKASDIVLPSLLRFSPLMSYAYNEFVKDVIESCANLSSNMKNEEFKRVYISRGLVRSPRNARNARGLVDSDSIEQLLHARGFSIIAPEKYSWQEQVTLFSNADVVMGEFGSGLHNTVFSPANTINIVLGNQAMNWNQSAIVAMRDQIVQYIQPKEQTKGGKLLVEYDPKNIERCLDCLLG